MCEICFGRFSVNELYYDGKDVWNVCRGCEDDNNRRKNLPRIPLPPALWHQPHVSVPGDSPASLFGSLRGTAFQYSQLEEVAAMIKIVRAIQTCMGCPSQWDAWDEEGNYYYLRYRHGTGEMRQYKDENWVEAPWKPDDEIDKNMNGWGIYANTSYIRTVAEFEYGDPLDGFMELDEFCRHAGVELDLETYTDYGTHASARLKHLLENNDDTDL